MPAVVLNDMETSHASLPVSRAGRASLAHRVVNRRRMRHAHMVNITGEVMTQGLRVDFNDIDRLSQALLVACVPGFHCAQIEDNAGASCN